MTSSIESTPLQDFQNPQPWADLPLKKVDDAPPPLPTNFDILHKQVQMDPDLSSGKIHDFSEIKKRPTDLELEPELAEESDAGLKEKALDYFLKGRSDLALTYFVKVKDKESIKDALGTVIDQCLEDKDFTSAEAFAGLIEDTDLREEGIIHIREQALKYAPTETGIVDHDGALDAFKGSGEVVNKVPISRPKIAVPEMLDISNLDDEEEIISDEDFDKFVKTGEVSALTLNIIANGIMRNETQTPREQAIYEAKGSEIEAILKSHLKDPVKPKVESQTELVAEKPVEKPVEEKAEDREIPTALELAMAETGGPLKEKELKTAVELAMEETNRFVDKKEPKVDEVKPAEPIEAREVAEIGPKTLDQQTEVDAKLEAELVSARDEYAKAYIDWEYKTRNSTKLFAKTMMALGVSKPAPERLTIKTSELEDAKEAYIKARANFSKNIMGDPGKLIDQVTSEKLRLGDKEQEFRMVKENFDQSLDDAREKGVTEKAKEALALGVQKALGVWTKNLTPGQRILVSSTLLAGGAVFAGAGLGAAAYYGGLRAVRAGAGLLGGQLTGMGMDSYQKDKNETRSAEQLEQYVKEINVDNLIAKEEELLKASEAEANIKKRQRLYKAGAVVGVGGAAALSAGATVGSVFKPEFMPADVDLKPKLDIELKPTVKVENVLETKVDLSSKGFIQDFHNLKANILGEYVGKEMPESLKVSIMNKTPTELAKQFGFYDQATNASGIGFKGESLGIDSEGDLYYQHLNGEKQIIFDSKTGQIYKYDAGLGTGEIASDGSEIFPNGKIGEKAFNKLDFGADKDLLAQIKVAPAEQLVDDPILTPKEFVPADVVGGVREIPDNGPVILADESKLDVTPKIQDTPSSPSIHIPLEGGKSVDVIDLGGKKVVTLDGLPISEEKNGILVLDDKYQDGAKNANIRSAFAKAFEESTKTDVLGPKPIAETFEGGKIYVRFGLPADPEKVSVLLNGKEIAVGNINNGTPKLSLLPGLKGNFLLADNVNERAFKHIDKMIKAKTFDFKI